jgi:hypothetical protein
MNGNSRRKLNRSHELPAIPVRRSLGEGGSRDGKPNRKIGTLVSKNRSQLMRLQGESLVVKVRWYHEKPRPCYAKSFFIWLARTGLLSLTDEGDAKMFEIEAKDRYHCRVNVEDRRKEQGNRRRTSDRRVSPKVSWAEEEEQELHAHISRALDWRIKR